MQTFKIHDNNGRPFTVKVKPNKVQVLKNINGTKYDETPQSLKVLFTVKVDHVFIGNRSPYFGHLYEWDEDCIGAAMLLKCGKQYIYIGPLIYSFTPVEGDEILDFFTDMGGSDVTYSYAVGKNYVYLFSLDVIVIKDIDFRQDIFDQFHKRKVAVSKRLKPKIIEKRRW